MPPSNRLPRAAATGPGDASRDKILDVAEALFARRGFAGVGLQEVAEGVGLRKSSLFHHFKSKMQLYLAVLQRVICRLATQLEGPLNLDTDPTEKLNAWVEALIDVLVEHPTTARLCLRALFEDGPEEDHQAGADVDEALGRLVAGFQALLQEGIDAGVFRAVSLPDTTQSVIGATVYHFASGEFGELLTGGPLFSAEAVARRKREVKDLLHAGLGRATPSTPSAPGE